MTTLDEAFALARDEHGLAIVATLRADQTIQASLVNVGLLPHPATQEQVLGFVTYGSGEAGEPAGASADRGHLSQRLAVGHR